MLCAARDAVQWPSLGISLSFPQKIVEPALAGLRLDHCFGKDRILHRIARPILKDDAISRNAETFEQPHCGPGFRAAVIN